MSRRSTPNQSAFLDHHTKPPQTKIVCSLRPSSDLQTIKYLLLSGMNVARIACAFGTQKELESLITRIRDASTITKRLCGIILETHGTSAMVGPVLISPTKKKNKNNTPIDNNKNTPIDNNNKKNSNGLQQLASILTLEVDNLPQNILQNASFAVDHILNQQQDITPEAQPDTQDENKNNEEEKKSDCRDSLTFPLAMSPRTQRSGSLVDNVPNDDPLGKHNNLSYDGDSFVIKPDIYLIKQTIVRIITDRIILGDRKKFSICFPGLCNKLSVGKHILIHPSIKLEIKSIDKSLNILNCLVLSGGPLKEYSKVEFPSLKIKNLQQNNHITQQDVTDIGFGVQNYVDYICISHCKSIRDINQTKEMLEFQTATFRNLKHNTSYDVSKGYPKNAAGILYKMAADNNISPIENDHINNGIKILAKIEDYQSLNDIYEIISGCDGIVIDHISLLHSYGEQHTETTDLKEKITEIVNNIVLETRKQAKPICICCDLTTNLLTSKDITPAIISDIERDLKVLNLMPGVPTNPQSFLTLDDISSVEYCVGFGTDSICILSNINRFKQIFKEHNTNNTLELNSNGYNDNNYNNLYLYGIIKSISDIVRNKEEISFAPNNMNSSYSNFMNKLKMDSDSNIINEEKDINNSNNNDDTSADSEYSDSDEQRKIIEVESIFNSMASSAVKSAFDLNCSLIIVLTQSGRIARIVSKYRPHCTILAITDSEMIAKQCMFISSIFPVLVLNMNGTDSLISRALYIAYKYKLIKKKNDKVVVLAGTRSDILDEPCDFIMKLLYVDL